MSDHSAEIVSALREIREFVQLLAEPAIAARDAKLRSQLRQIVGRSAPRGKSVLLMNGGRSQSEIRAATGIHKGELSTLVKKLGEAQLLNGDPKLPLLRISIPSNFFDTNAETN